MNKNDGIISLLQMINSYKIDMDGADWKKLLFFGSLSGLGVWGFKWHLRTLEKLEIKRD